LPVNVVGAPDGHAWFTRQPKPEHPPSDASTDPNPLLLATPESSPPDPPELLAPEPLEDPPPPPSNDEPPPPSPSRTQSIDAHVSPGSHPLPEVHAHFSEPTLHLVPVVWVDPPQEAATAIAASAPQTARPKTPWPMVDQRTLAGLTGKQQTAVSVPPGRFR
jgi:hypothetical protein